MRYTGAFLDINGRRVEVELLTADGTQREYPLGEGDILFADSPVSIQTSYNGPDDVLERESCTLRFLMRGYRADMFGKEWCDTRVTVTREGTELFKGFVEPFSYTQPYNELYDEVELGCLDLLGALQLMKYGDVGRPGVDYDARKSKAGMLDIDSILLDILGRLDDSGYVYDDSRRPDSTPGSSDLLSRVTVDERLFYGDTEDDTWTMEDVVTELLRYLNLQICRHGSTFHVHAPDSHWGGAQTGVMISPETVWGGDATLTVPEMFNKITVRAELQPVEELVSDPLVEDDTVPVYPKRTLWCSEYMAYALDDFRKICGLAAPGALKYKGWRKDHWVRVLDHPGWKFGAFTGNSSAGTHIDDFYAANFQPGVNDQSEAVNRLGEGGTCCLMELTTGRQDYDRSDNGIPSDTTTARYLVIGVGGDGKSAQGTLADEMSKHQQHLLGGAPLATYESAGLTLSPADDSTTRYLVIKGKMRLNPVHNPMNTWRSLSSGAEAEAEEHETDEEEKKANGKKNRRYYTRRYWKGDPPADNLESPTSFPDRLQPPEDDSYYEALPYSYSAQGSDADAMSDLPVLACMLIVGDKCLVGTPGKAAAVGQEGSLTGAEFSWQPYRTLEQCGGNKSDYYAQCFWIGIDPAIGDSIIGPEHDIRNNIHYLAGLGASGMAIPVRRTDSLSGKVTFHILGAYNQIWEEITRRHHTFFRHTAWTSRSRCLLEYVSSIWIKDFAITVISDNAGDDAEEGDIIYVSDTDESFIHEKEEQVMRVNSALTDAERRMLGVPDTVSLSTARLDGKGLLTVYDAVNDREDKPEALYVDWHFREESRQRVRLEQGMKDTGISRNGTYSHPALPGKEFRCAGISREVKEASARVILEEILNVEF